MKAHSVWLISELARLSRKEAVDAVCQALMLPLRRCRRKNEVEWGVAGGTKGLGTCAQISDSKRVDYHAVEGHGRVVERAQGQQQQH